MEIIDKIIAAILVVSLLAAGTIPIINDVGRAHDADDIQAPMGAYDADELDGYSLTASRYSGHVKVESTFYTGEIKDWAVIVSTSGGSLWTDGSKIYSLIGGELRTVTSTTITVEGGDFMVDGQTVEVDGIVYLPDKLGIYGSYPDMVHGQPVAAVGSYAGVAVGSIGEDVTGNSTDYVLDVSPMETGGENGIEYVPGEVEHPEVDSFLPDIEHEKDPDPEPVEPGEYVASGTTGQCTWELDGTVLYIRGNGKTADYYTDASPPPWGRELTAVYVEEGVTDLGVKLFQYCPDLAYVSLPSTLISLGQYIFRGCTALKAIEIPVSLTHVYTGAFYNCSGLESLVFPEGLVSMEANVIQRCTGLRHLYLPEGIESVGTQGGFHFIRLDGYDMGTTPTGDLYLGAKQYVMYQTKTIVEGGATYHINYIGAELEAAQNTETVHIPYSVTYDGTDYTVESVAHGAISGSAVRYVVIPQTIESISSTAITGSKVAEVLNLSAVDVTTSHGEVRTSVPAVAVVSDTVIDPSFGAVMSMINLVPILIVLALVGFVLTGARGRARER